MKKQSLLADILQTVSKYFLVFIAIMLAYILCSGIRIVDSGNVALILRFGKLVGSTYDEQVHKPGLLFALPDFIDEVVIIPSGNVMQQTVTTHYTAPENLTDAKGGYLITGDQNIAVASASVKYVVSNPVDYALHIKDMEKIIHATVSTAMVNESARIGVDQLLTSGKDAYSAAVLKFASQKLDALHAGITITSLELTQIAMPAEVKTLYDEVNSASVRAQTILEQANQYRENLLPEAQSKAHFLISEAQAYHSSSVAEANARLAEFWGHLEEYKKNPEVVTVRLYNSKVRQLIAEIGQIRVVEDGDSHIILNP